MKTKLLPPGPGLERFLQAHVIPTVTLTQLQTRDCLAVLERLQQELAFAERRADRETQAELRKEGKDVQRLARELEQALRLADPSKKSKPRA